jgi:hypothetical protein
MAHVFNVEFQVRKMSVTSITPPPDETTIATTTNKSNNNNKTSNNNNNRSPSKRVDINEFLSAILYRTRKGEYR